MRAFEKFIHSTEEREFVGRLSKLMEKMVTMRSFPAHAENPSVRTQVRKWIYWHVMGKHQLTALSNWAHLQGRRPEVEYIDEYLLRYQAVQDSIQRCIETEAKLSPILGAKGVRMMRIKGGSAYYELFKGVDAYLESKAGKEERRYDRLLPDSVMGDATFMEFMREDVKEWAAEKGVTLTPEQIEEKARRRFRMFRGKENT
jgi:hypothetical protein